MKSIIFSLLIIVCSLGAHCQNKCDSIPDVICDANFKNLRNGVVQISLTNSAVSDFTGFMVNDVAQDGRFLILTTAFPFGCYRLAGFNAIMPGTHISSSDINFFWGEDLPNCGAASATLAGTTGGATLLAEDGQFALLESDNGPPFTPVYLGWDFSSATIGTGVKVDCIYQNIPSNNPKKIIADSGTTATQVIMDCTNINSFVEDPTGTGVIKVTKWVKGQPSFQESRGAPLFLLSDKKVVGVYVGGNEDATDCPGGPSYFFDFSTMGSDITSILGENASHQKTNSITITPCVTDLSLSGNTWIGTNTVAVLKASNTITSTQNIQDGAGLSEVIYEAGGSITLDDGFASGTDFIALIKPCNSTITVLKDLEDSDGNDLITEGTRIIPKDSAIGLNIKVYPTIIDVGASFTIATAGNQSITAIPCLFDINGQLIAKYPPQSLSSTANIILKSPDGIATGMYLLNLAGDQFSRTYKLLIK